MRLRDAALLTAWLTAATPAAAQTEPGRVELLVGTEFPQWIGGGVSVGLGRRARLQSTVGASAPAYVDVVHRLVDAFANLRDAERDALRRAVDGFIVWRTHALWRPSPSLGLEVGGGFGLVVLQGAVSSEVAQALAMSSTGVIPPPADLRALLFQADVEAAWRVPLGASLALRFALDLGVTFFTDTRVAPRYRVSAETPASQAALDRSAASIDAWVSRWRLLPGLAVTLHLTL